MSKTKKKVKAKCPAKKIKYKAKSIDGPMPFMTIVEPRSYAPCDTPADSFPLWLCGFVFLCIGVALGWWMHP
jgi:hypothetical protein